MKEKLQNGMLTLRKHWLRPCKGECVSYKEVSAFSVGGMGVKSISSLLGYMTLTANCLLIASVYQLSPRNIMYLFIITNIIGIIKTPFVSMLVDSTMTKIGKFRPYLMWAGIPSVIGLVGLAWFVPMNGSPLTKMILIGIFFNLVSIAQPIYNNAYMGISQVITPNSHERTKILGFSEFLANLGPSIVQFLLPTIAGIFFGKDGMENIWTYRIFVPIFAVSSFLLGLLVMYSTKERIIQPINAQTKVKFFQGMKYMSKNKYFWIVTISKFFDGFKGVLTLLLVWVCTYQLGNSSMLGIIQTITSIGFTPGIILAPLIMKKLGSRMSGFVSHLLNCLAALVMLFTFKQGFPFFVISLFLYNFALGPQYVIQNSILSDGFDYQQDKQGIRIEGFAQNFMLMITTIGTILSTVVFTMIYEKYGLVANADTGMMDYTILKDATIRENIIQAVIVVVIIASVLSAIPYLFCNLTQDKLKVIRLSLEKKKFVADNNLAEESQEVVDEKFQQYLDEIVKKENIVAEQLVEEKQALKEKQEANAKKLAEEKLARQNAFAEMTEKGMSKKEINKIFKAEDNAKKLAKKEKMKAMFANIKKDRIQLKARRKVFANEWMTQAKANGEKKYLKILANEAFNELLLSESNGEKKIDLQATQCELNEN